MTTVEIVENWNKEIESGLKANYKRLGLRASGKWERELDTEVQTTSTGVRSTIYGMNYTEQLSIGRKKGSFPPIDAIKDWIKDKGIKPNGISTDSLAFLIGRKIKEQGIKVPNKYNAGGLVSDVLNEKSVALLGKEVGFAFVEQSRSEIVNILKSTV